MAQSQLIMPRPWKAKVMIWADLSFSAMDLIEEAKTADQLRDLLAGFFALRSSDPRDSVLLDLYLHTVLFSREQGLSKEQGSAFLSIVKTLHQACVETPLANEQHCFQYLSELLLCHSVRRPPFSVDLFSAEQVKRLAEFVINTYFRHFKLYKYMFTPQVRLDVTLSYTGMSEESVIQEDEEQKPSSSPEPRSEEQSPDTALVEEQGPSPRAELRHYIQSELSAEVSRLQASVEEKLRLNAEALSSKLAQLEERSAGQRDKSHKGKRK